MLDSRYLDFFSDFSNGTGNEAIMQAAFNLTG